VVLLTFDFSHVACLLLINVNILAAQKAHWRCGKAPNGNAF